MSSRQFAALALVLIFLIGSAGAFALPRAVPVMPALNPDGSPVTAVITAQFDPAEGVLPFPNNLLLSGSADLTLSIPVADPNDFSDPQVALNALDGFSTVAPWTFSFSRPVNPASVVPGQSVRLFEVQMVFGTIAVQQVNRELVPGQDYVTSVTGGGTEVAIVPLRPLDEMTAYMAVVTNGITDQIGNIATPSQTYFLSKRRQPLVDEQGRSTEPLLPDATTQALEPLRQLTNAQEAAAASVGIDPDNIVLSWTATTQAVTPVLSIVRSLARPTGIQVAPTGLTTAEALPPGASPGIADIFIGVVDVPYFLGVPSAENPVAPLNTFWQAEPGAYIPPFDGLGLDPTSTNITVANPIPVQRDLQTVPVLLTVPNQLSGQVRPAGGWPVAIFQHGITGNRTNMLAIADTMASVGFVTIAIDQPLHGVTDIELGDPDQPLAAFHVANTPFGAIANERTFDLDLVDNDTGAPGPDGRIDPSGQHFINLQNLLVARDNLRQAQADLSVLALNIPDVDLTGDGLPDLDGADIHFIGMSLGAMAGIPFLTVEPTVNNGVLSVPGGGIANLLAGSQTFGPIIRAGLTAAGVEPDSPEFFQFLGAAQQVVDSADPINWGARTVLTNSVLLHQVAGDTVIPNAVPGAPLSGTEPLIRVMGLDAITDTTFDPEGIRGAARFVEGIHSSLLDPAVPEVFVEMQGQAASMIATGGTTVLVGDPELLESE